MNRNWIVSTLAISLLGGAAHAAVTLPKIISKNMILQADMADPIWGTASPDEKITVEINGHKKEATAGADGKWMVKLDPEKAGGPYSLQINETKIDNVLIGEVWHASGQSNMHFAFNFANTFAVDQPKADYPTIRYYQVDGKGNGTWEICSPKTCGRFSAIAYYFAQNLQEHLKCPVGIIDTSVSGALIQTFLSPSSMEGDPAFTQAADTQKNDQGISTNFSPMIAPIIPYGIRGVIWYQGEGNRDFPTSYQTLFAGMIKDWRKLWGQEKPFPFLFVQLANWRERKAEPFLASDVGLREAQAKTLAVENTAMAVAIDLGEPSLAPGKGQTFNPNSPPPGNFDAMNVHFRNKKPLGERLAVAAYALAYGEKVEYSGPEFKDAKFAGGNAVVNFTHIGAGLTASGPVKGFLLAGEDKSWVRADAEIVGSTVVVHSPKCANPVAVRYAYEENPECNLCNKEGLPAVPFRSDDWVQPGLKDKR